jgi:hypothetical protein
MIWALSIMATAAMAQRLTISPTLVSGNDVGFRIERTVDGVPFGRLVVRVDGRWGGRPALAYECAAIVARSAALCSYVGFANRILTLP